ncbi:WASH complex subunit 2 [Drosophila innubila]|uniref:WASH complex subunit 2 n=1 Tax=Drosophila innubila TaxID=198719 RepID=UPI00148C718B|nr:WASH complex subunit 2 [Drosophila innubila]
MDISADVAAIIKQAPDWNFAGDCALLELMKRISQNLQERGEQTSNNLNAFETNVRRADIALDNATNSLRSLQFGQQFVEYRVEEVDDDDFAMPEELNRKPEVPPKSSQEMAKEFLQNNLQMFRKNFEPVTIEVPDSDDEDGALNTTTVFRAKNPYDVIPLPYIIGSKDWQEHKYAGLYDSAENSEDEQPEQFSSSSSDELEAENVTEKTTSKPSLKMETPQQSDSSSLASLPKELPHPPPARAAVPVPVPVIEAVAPIKAQPRPIISSHRNPHERDLFNALRASPPSDDPPSTSSSLNSGMGGATASRLPHVDVSLSSSSSNSNVRQSPVKLFEDAITVAPVPAPTPISIPTVIPTALKEETVVKASPAASQIKRKPVNLFNDDEFNSFMSEIVDKVQSKSSKESTQESSKATKSLNLFDESPPLTPKTTPAVKTLPTSIFDDNLEDDDDFLSSFASKAMPKPQPQTRATTLFDDDDDELDINDIFKSSKQPKAESNLKTKNWLFDDDDLEEKDIFGLSQNKQEKKKREQKRKEQDEYGKKEAENKVKLEQEERKQQEKKQEHQVATSIPHKSLFDDLDDDDLFGTPKSKQNLFEDAKKTREELKAVEEKELPEDKDVPVVPKVTIPDKPILNDEDQAKNNLMTTEREALKKQNSQPKAKLLSDDFSDEESIKETEEKATATIEIPKDSQQPINKMEEVEIKNKSDLFDNSRKDPTEQVQQDPILSLVADTVSNKQLMKNANQENPRKSEEIAIAQQMLQNYSSLFSDEPPDDSEFFQSLGSSSLNSLSNSKMFDQEQDFFEPSLPDLPKDVAKANVETVEDYGGLRLFSDVPPEDDGEEELPAPKTAPKTSLPATTRIHTIFYDDFSETARAQNVPATPAPSQSQPAAADVVDRSVSKTTPISPIKKLQMPNININVKALLPGAGTGAVSKLAKRQKEEQEQKNLKQEQQQQNQKQEPKNREQQQENREQEREQKNREVKSVASDADKILQCIGKTRARGPAHRRPSTRRARQENYAKSLREEVESTKGTIDATPATANLKHEQKLEQSAPLSSDISKKAAASKLTASRSEAAFVESDDDDDALFKVPAVSSAATPNVPTTTAPIALLSTRPPADDQQSRGKTITKVAASFLDSDEDDSGLLFTPANAVKKQVSFLDSDEEIEKNTTLFKPAKIQVETKATAATVIATESPLPSQKALEDQGTSKSSSLFLDSQEDVDNPEKTQVETKSDLVTPVALPSRKSLADQQQKKLPSSFLDSDENDDDDNSLFGPLKKPVKSAEAELKISKGEQSKEQQITKPTTAPVVKQNEVKSVTDPVRKYVSFLDSDEDDVKHPPPQFNPAKIQPPETKSKAILASKLFDDSDDDDDLFGKANAPPTKPKSKPVAKPKASLFADSDSEKEARPKVLSIKAKLPAKSSKSLFSDDEDDDDLFGGGGGTKRAAVSSQTKTANLPKSSNPGKTAVKSLPSSGNSDNPLADLLGP